MFPLEKAKNKIDPEILEMAEEKYNLQAVSRIILICWCISVAYTLFGFISYELVSSYDSTISLFSNVWPRLLFNVVPFLILIKFLYSPRISPLSKINAYIWVYCVVFFISSSIYVWPIALTSDPSIILYVSAANVIYLCATWTIAAIPTKLMMRATIGVSLFIVAPIFFVISKSSNSLLIATVVNDTVLSVVVGLGCGYLLSRLHWKLQVVYAQQVKHSSEFLGKPLQEAIYKGKTNILKEQKVSGYIFFLDIRDSTKLAKKYGNKWDNFCSDWITRAGRIIEKNHGNFIKSSGDGILGGFGLFDDLPDLDDIPEIENEREIADERRWGDLTKETFNCLEELIYEFMVFSKNYFPDENLRIGCGVDRGFVTRGVRGSQDKKEFDIWGDRVNIASKLESLCKDLYKYSNLDVASSIMVVSPFACDYLERDVMFNKVDLDKAMRSKAHGVPWILFKEFKVNTNSYMIRKKAS